MKDFSQFAIGQFPQRFAEDFLGTLLTGQWVNASRPRACWFVPDNQPLRRTPWKSKNIHHRSEDSNWRPDFWQGKSGGNGRLAAFVFLKTMGFFRRYEIKELEGWGLSGKKLKNNNQYIYILYLMLYIYIQLSKSHVLLRWGQAVNKDSYSQVWLVSGKFGHLFKHFGVNFLLQLFVPLGFQKRFLQGEVDLRKARWEDVFGGSAAGAFFFEFEKGRSSLMERFSKTWGIRFFQHMYALDGEKETDERLQKMCNFSTTKTILAAAWQPVAAMGRWLAKTSFHEWFKLLTLHMCHGLNSLYWGWSSHL